MSKKYISDYTPKSPISKEQHNLIEYNKGGIYSTYDHIYTEIERMQMVSVWTDPPLQGGWDLLENKILTIDKASIDEPGTIEFSQSDDDISETKATTPVTANNIIKSIIDPVDVNYQLKYFNSSRNYTPGMVVRGTDNNLYMCISENGPDTNNGIRNPVVDIRFTTSSDYQNSFGLSWEIISNELYDSGWTGIGHNKNNGTTILFKSGIDSILYKSANTGWNWRVGILPYSANWVSIACNPKNDSFVLCALSDVINTSGCVVYSTDGGQTWNSSSYPSTSNIQNVICNEDTGFFYFTTRALTNQIRYSENNGQTWISMNISNSYWHNSFYDPFQKACVFVGYTTDNASQYNKLCYVWSPTNYRDLGKVSGSRYTHGVINENTTVGIITTYDLEFLLTTKDNTTLWTTVSDYTPKPWISIACNPDINRFLMITNNEYGYSDDNGVTWIIGSLPNPSNYPYSKVIFDYRERKFVITSSSVSTVGTSSDGVTWTFTGNSTRGSSYIDMCLFQESSIDKIATISYNSGLIKINSLNDNSIDNVVSLPNSDICSSIAYNHRTNKMLICGFKHTNNYFYSDSYGQSWLIGSLPYYGIWRKVLVKYIGTNNSRFVIVSDATNKFVWSDDGINWNISILPCVGNWRVGTYSTNPYDPYPQNAKLVVFSYDNYNVIYSNDGINWETSVLPFKAKWSDIVYDYKYNRYIGIAKESDRFVYSDNCKEWYEVKVPLKSNWSKIITNGDSRFIVFSDGYNYILTSDDGYNWQVLPFIRPYDIRGAACNLTTAMCTGYNSNELIKTSLDIDTNKYTYWSLFDNYPVGTIIDYIQFKDNNNPSSVDINYVKMDGRILNRTLFPELWTIAQTSNMIVNETQWFDNQNKYSTGDGTTTFRIPNHNLNDNLVKFIKVKNMN